MVTNNTESLSVFSALTLNLRRFSLRIILMLGLLTDYLA